MKSFRPMNILIPLRCGRFPWSTQSKHRRCLPGDLATLRWVGLASAEPQSCLAKIVMTGSSEEKQTKLADMALMSYAGNLGINFLRNFEISDTQSFTIFLDLGSMCRSDSLMSDQRIFKLSMHCTLTMHGDVVVLISLDVVLHIMTRSLRSRSLLRSTSWKPNHFIVNRLRVTHRSRK